MLWLTVLPTGTGDQTNGELLNMRTLVYTLVLVMLLPALAASQQRYQPTPEQRFVDATGRADIVYGDEHSARVRAMRDAIQNASMQVSSQVRSAQTVQDGRLTVDQLRVHSAAQVTQVEVMAERVSQGTLELDIQARVSETQMCSNHVVNDFAKSAAVTGFPMADPTQATIGHLGSVDRKLAAQLVNAINTDSGLRALDASHLALYSSVASAPTQMTARNTLTRAIDTAQDLGVQFVISGVVRDLGMEEVTREVRDDEGVLAHFGVGRTTNQRHLVLDVYVHDGYSGALVFQSRYAAQGLWEFRSNERVGFGTPAFYGSDFGDQTRHLMQRVVSDLQETVQCQPFMASIAQVSGERIYIDMGAESGLRPGDDLSVYRTSTFFDRQQQSYQELTDTKLVARVVQVQPNFAIAELPVRAERLNLQADDLVIAW